MRCPTPSCRLPERAASTEASTHASHLYTSLGRLHLSGTARRDVDALRKLHSSSRAARAALCPHCHHVSVSEVIRGATQDRGVDVICESEDCRTSFCVTHGNLHPGERCADFVARTPIDASRRDFARRMHTRRCPRCLSSIVKNGGCDHMRCVCGYSFSWSAATVEVPCNCLNLRNTSGQCVPWGAPPCKGASATAHAKLAAWRCGFGALASPCIVVGAPVAATVFLVRVLAPMIVRNGFGWISQAQTAAQLRARGHAPGSFIYNFHMHGSGRTLPIRQQR